jgi:hypothetical protein
MQGYVRVSPAGSNVPIAYSIGTNNGDTTKPAIASRNGGGGAGKAKK